MKGFPWLRRLMVLMLLGSHGTAYAWHDQTHLAVSKAAGYREWYNSAAADMVKTKAHQVEEYNHWYNNNKRAEITAETVLEQAGRYDDGNDPEGHLLGAIIGSLREYQASKVSHKYAEYNLAFCAHYVGDLSQPLHNTPYNDFNKSHHLDNDGVVEKDALTDANLQKIRNRMYPICLKTERDLAREIARIANLTRLLGYRLEKENRNMTTQEAYLQLGHSASLLKAILAYVHDDKAEGIR